MLLLIVVYICYILEVYINDRANKLLNEGKDE